MSDQKQKKRIRDWHMSLPEKQFAALRILYKAGYTGFFTKQANTMLRKSFTADELLSASIDAEMKRWVESVVNRVPIIAVGNDKR